MSNKSISIIYDSAEVRAVDCLTDVLSREDIAHIKDAVHEQLPNMKAFAILLSIKTGMRASEVVALKWEDVGDRTLLLGSCSRTNTDYYCTHIV